MQTKDVCSHVNRDDAQRAHVSMQHNSSQLKMRSMHKRHDLTASHRQGVRLSLRHPRGLNLTMLLRTRRLRE